MSKDYNPGEIEAKWQAKWKADGLYRSVIDRSKPKHYALTMYPYPSGDLHMGHWYSMAPPDALARYHRMKGYNVLFPMGFDSFGLPAENAAFDRGIHPKTWTYDNMARMQQQMESMGAMFDWDRRTITSDPEYYKWTQWFFIKFFENGLAYRKMSPVDFCPHCNTTLAREQVKGDERVCDRCGTPVIKKNLEQWFFRITNYADELLDYSGIDWPEPVQIMQHNWIGRSEGAQVTFHSENEDPIEVFTTRPDTLWGATFMVLAPEHPLLGSIVPPDYLASVNAYKEQVARTTDMDREKKDREKTGVFSGAYAVNPVNNERVPIWIADYVLMSYGSGAIMGVPAHDERDFEFAMKFGLPIIPVIAPPDGKAYSVVATEAVDAGFGDAVGGEGIACNVSESMISVEMASRAEADAFVLLAQQYVKSGHFVAVAGSRFAFVFDDGVIDLTSAEADREIVARAGADAGRTAMEILENTGFSREMTFHHEYGVMINSGAFDGTPGESAVADVTKWLEKQNTGEYAVQYRLHDWLISRQRYWGAPIPIVYCDEHGAVPVKEEDLPVLLPDDVTFDNDRPENPLTKHEGYLNTTCPICGEPARRETDTMDTFMCSSWYQFRYMDPHYDGSPMNPEEAAYWLPVDQYTGGIEHATMHLMYTRFFTKAMRDSGLFEGIAIEDKRAYDEPMMALFNQGMVLGEDNEKMSKSRGNVVAPDDLVKEYGADAVRGYMMFAFRWDQGGPWMSKDIVGQVRFLRDIWTLIEPQPDKPKEADAEATTALLRRTHQTISRVTDGLENFRFNTAIAALMEMKNEMQDMKATMNGTAAWDEAQKTMLLLLAPFMPHVTEELWERIGGPYSIHQQSWPEFDPELAAEEEITLVVQVNGKVRDRIQVPADISDDDAKAAALASENVRNFTNGGEPRDVIVVPGRLVNIVM